MLKGLELGCSGIITATCNVTAELSRRVYDDFFIGQEQASNQKLCDVRSVFERYNLISGLHTYYTKKHQIYKNVLPPERILDLKNKKELSLNIDNRKIFNPFSNGSIKCN